MGSGHENYLIRHGMPLILTYKIRLFCVFEGKKEDTRKIAKKNRDNSDH